MELEEIKKKIQEIEAAVHEQRSAMGRLEALADHFKTTLEKLQERVEETYKKNVATCDDCAIEFDLFAHHYSIGLFDNIVYVKCPRCQKAFPVDPKGGVKKQ